jgi:hypothetical protein
MKSYKQICKELANMDSNHPAKSAQLDLISEYGEFNYMCCCAMMGILNDWDYSYEKDCGCEYYEAPPLDEVKIRTLAGFIHNRGGLHTLQMNFYVMLHFHAEDVNTKRKVQQLTHIWDGVGQWRH